MREGATDLGVELTGTDGDIAKEAMGSDGDAANDEWRDSSVAFEDKDEAPEDSRGVDSEAGGMLMPVLASRLHTGQNVLHAVSQESTQIV